MSMKKVAEISEISNVTDFCTFYKKPLKKPLIFEKFLQEFSWIPTTNYLPDNNLKKIFREVDSTLSW